MRDKLQELECKLKATKVSWETAFAKADADKYSSWQEEDDTYMLYHTAKEELKAYKALETSHE